MKVISLKSLKRAAADYVREAPRESDDFLEGLDVTGKAAREVFKDLILFIEQCQELYMGEIP